MAPLKCCVGGCNATSDSHRLFSMTKDDNLRSLWMYFLVPSNPLLIGLTTEQLLKKRVCQKHFDRSQFDEQGRRIRYSYPCLFSDKEIAHGMPLTSEEYHVLNEHNYHLTHEENDNDDSAETLLVIRNSDDGEQVNEHSYPLCSPAIPSCYDKAHKKMASPISTQKQKADARKAFRNRNVTKTDKQLEAVNTEAETDIIEHVLEEPVEEDFMQPASPIDIPAPERAAFSWQKCSAAVPCDAHTAASESELRGAGDDVFMYDDVTAEPYHHGAADRGEPPLVPGSAGASRDCGAGYRCDSCAELVSGFRYTCVQCADYDLCAACEASGAHALHYVLRVPADRPYAEIQSVLASIRRTLLSDSIVGQVVTEDNVKTEVKEEQEELVDPLCAERPALAAGSEAEPGAREEGSEVDYSDDDGGDDVTWSPHSCTESESEASTTTRAHRAGSARVAPGTASERAGTPPKKLQQRCDELNYSTRAIMPLESWPRTTRNLIDFIEINIPEGGDPARRKGSEPPAGEAAARTASRNTCDNTVLDVRLAHKRKIAIPARSKLDASLENESPRTKKQKKNNFKESLGRIILTSQETDPGGTSLSKKFHVMSDGHVRVRRLSAAELARLRAHERK